MSEAPPRPPQSRLVLVLAAVVLAALALVAWALDLQILRVPQLRSHRSYLDTVSVSAQRGEIVDRNDRPLAVSVPVQSVGANPGVLLERPEPITELAGVIGWSGEELRRHLQRYADRQFVWLERRVDRGVSDALVALDRPGIELRTEYRRFYPTVAVTSQLRGFTNVDDVGQEGLELAYDEWLSGHPGRKRVIRGRNGHIVEDVEMIEPVKPGRDLQLTIDRRLQYLAYRELSSAVQRYGAGSGSIVLMQVNTGEILAMANVPAYNPNDLERNYGSAIRNRAVTDAFEPGSVLKPFTIAAALEANAVQPDTVIDVSGGRLELQDHTIQDTRDYGRLTVTGVIRKSSNVGASKIARRIDGGHFKSVLRRFGFGSVTGTGFPGEAAGILHAKQQMRPLEQATLAYGYGITVTPLQLAQAYAALANGGWLRRPLLALNAESQPLSVIDPAVAEQVMGMLQTVVGPEGTAERARIPMYSVAGKTGTARKVGAGGYQENRHVASFAGFAPASDPQLVCVVVINDLRTTPYYGGVVAAPVFRAVVESSLRLLNIPPDRIPAYAGRQRADNTASAEGQ